MSAGWRTVEALRLPCDVGVATPAGCGCSCLPMLACLARDWKLHIPRSPPPTHTHSLTWRSGSTPRSMPAPCPGCSGQGTQATCPGTWILACQQHAASMAAVRKEGSRQCGQERAAGGVGVDAASTPQGAQQAGREATAACRLRSTLDWGGEGWVVGMLWAALCTGYNTIG